MCATLFALIIIMAVPTVTQAQQTQQIQMSSTQTPTIDQAQVQIKTLLENDGWGFASSQTVSVTTDTIFSIETYTKTGMNSEGNPTTLELTIGKKSPNPDTEYIMAWGFPNGIWVWCECQSTGFCETLWGGGQFYCFSNGTCMGSYCKLRAGEHCPLF